jgi:hypothetical protein
MRLISAILASLLLSGCVNGFEKYYSPAPGSERISSSPYMDKPPAEPRVYAHSSDPNADAKRLAEDGYVLIGSSSFYGPANKVTQAQAVEEGKKVGAAIVMVRSSYKDTLSGALPYTVANPTQYATVNTTGTVNSYGSGGYANGTYNSSSTVAMPGGYSTYSIPYNISRNDFYASFWAKRSPEKMRLGVNPAPLTDELRQRLQRNTGVFVLIVVRGTPAFRANILEGDVILKINGADVIDPQGFSDQLTQFAGQSVEISLIRGQEPVTVHVTLNPNPPGVH